MDKFLTPGDSDRVADFLSLQISRRQILTRLQVLILSIPLYFSQLFLHTFGLKVIRITLGSNPRNEYSRRILDELLKMFLLKRILIFKKGAHDSVVVKALCYKPEGRGFGTL
jgi:hypothetical protein